MSVLYSSMKLYQQKIVSDLTVGPVHCTFILPLRQERSGLDWNRSSARHPDAFVALHANNELVVL